MCVGRINNENLIRILGRIFWNGKLLIEKYYLNLQRPDLKFRENKFMY